MKKQYLVALGITMLSHTLVFGDTGPKIIYGEDNRVEAMEYPDAYFREAALSVAGKVRSYKLTLSDTDNSIFNFRQTSLQSSANVCEEERFSQQVSLPNCTGFLVAPDVLVTAGHCIVNEVDCQTSSWVFDFYQTTTEIKKKDVYNCKEVLKQELVSKWFKLRDYAVIRLDRKVEEKRKPLPIRDHGKLRTESKILVIGHPSGLPLKIADGANVKPVNIIEILTPIRTIVRKQSYFLSNLDTFGGNSGSPVFNQETGKVEGILIQGAEDYVPASDGRMCLVSNRRSNSTWTASEKAFRITKVKDLSKIIKDSKKRNQ